MSNKTKEEIAIESIRSNYELWRKGELKDGAFSFHVHSNLQTLESTNQFKPKWIPVSERLPEKNVEVLVWRQYWDIPIQAYINVKGEWLASRETRDWMIDGYVNNAQLSESPTHWMPLPEKPTE